MKSGFMELVVRNRLAGKSLSAGRMVRYQAVDSFRKYIGEVLPQMEEAVEMDLLRKCLTKIQSVSLRQELVQSYLRRLFRMRLYQHQEIETYKKIAEISPEQNYTLVDPTILKNVQQHSDYDRGSYVMFSNEEMVRLFKYGCYGNYKKDEWEYTQRFGVMIRREGLAIAQVMRVLQQGKWSLADLLALPHQDRLYFLDNQQVYPILFQEVSKHIYACAQKYRAHQNYTRAWASCVITDVLTHSILQATAYHDDPLNLAQQAVHFVMALEVCPSGLDFVSRFHVLPLTPPVPVHSKPPYFSGFGYTTPSFKSVYLGGVEGAGRSMILTYVTVVAHRAGWIIVNVPDSTAWTQDKKTKPERMYNGLFVIHEHAVQWLDHFLSTNQAIVQNMSVDLSLYGQLDVTGFDPSHFTPVPNLYDPKRKVYFNSIAEQLQFRTNEDKEHGAEYKIRLTNVLPTPVTVADIIRAGIEHPTYATCAMGEVLRQVYASDHLVLECVDSYSWLYRASVYNSFRYFNDRGLFGRIPPYHLAHCRMFIDLDGHKLKRGLKVVAASRGKLHKHKMNIKMLSLPEEYEHKVQNLTPDEFKKAARYTMLTGHWDSDLIQRANPLYVYTLSQGNWRDFQQVIELAHYY